MKGYHAYEFVGKSVQDYSQGVITEQHDQLFPKPIRASKEWLLVQAKLTYGHNMRTQAEMGVV